MSSPVPPTGCGCPPTCPNPIVENIPGPAGAAGENAFGFTSAVMGFTVPNANVQIPIVVQSGTMDWATPGQVIFIQTAGYYSFDGFLFPETQILATNLGYSGNASPLTFITPGQQISPGGIAGATGTLNTISPTTTKGDILADNGVNNPNASVIRVGVGADGKVLTAKSAATPGVEWDSIDLTGAATSFSGQLPLTLGGTGKASQQAALNNLMPSSPVLGDLCYFDGTNWIRFPISVGSFFRQVLRINAAGTSIEYAYQGCLQVVQTSTASSILINTTYSLADTLPTTGGGQQVLSTTITPTNSTSRLVIRAAIPVGGISTNIVIGAIFTTTGGSNAVQAFQIAANGVLYLQYEFAPGTTSTQTIAVRVGANTGNAGVNGNGSARLFGGASSASLIIEEYA